MVGIQLGGISVLEDVYNMVAGGGRHSGAEVCNELAPYWCREVLMEALTQSESIFWGVFGWQQALVLSEGGDREAA